jgi:hypothetical protein
MGLTCFVWEYPQVHFGVWPSLPLKERLYDQNIKYWSHYRLQLSSETFFDFFTKTKVPFLRHQPSVRSEMKPLTLYRGYDYVLLGQGYRTPRGVVIDEYGAMVEWWLAGETPAAVPLSRPWITLEVTRVWTRASMIRSQRLAARARTLFIAVTDKTWCFTFQT